MKYSNIPYEALDGTGLPYMRDARVIDELPTPEMRLQACAEATAEIGKLLGLKPTRRIPYGAPIYEAFGLTRPQAKAHPKAALLLQFGCALDLEHCG